MFQFPGFPSVTYGFSNGLHNITCAEFPHSDICGSQDICSSPQLFAAYRVFHRLLVPRHPPCALYSLTCCNSSFFGLVTSIHSVVCLLFEIFISFFACFGCLLVYLLLSGWFLLQNLPYRRWYFKIIFNIRFSRYGFFFWMFPSSGDGEIRTLDPLLARQALSQLS